MHKPTTPEIAASPASRAERGFILALLCTALLLGVAYVVASPAFTGPDEVDHLQYVRTLVESGGAKVEGLQAKQPASYYWLTAPVYLLVRGQPQPLQLAALRLVSVALFLGEVLLAYLAARRLSPSNPFVYLSTAAIVALLPGRVWLAATLNNDNLASLASTALIYLVARGVMGGFDRVTRLCLLVALPAALLSKLSSWVVVVVVVGVIAVVAIRRSATSGILARRAFRIAAAVAASALLTLAAADCVASWSALSGDSAPATVDRLEGASLRLIKGPLAPLDRMSGMRLSFIHLTWRTMIQIPPPQLEPFALQFKSFWFPVWEYDNGLTDESLQLPLLVSALAVVGIAVGLVRFFRRGDRVPADRRKAVCLAVLALMIVATWLWILLQFLIVVGGTGSFMPNSGLVWSAHARYLFPVLVPIAFFLATGLRQFIPVRWSPLGLAALVAVLLYLQVIVLANLISRSYWWPA